MSTFDLLADLPLEVDGYELEGLQANVSSGFERLSTVVHLHGGGHEGVGEDVVYDAEDHVALQEAGPVHARALSGRFTLAEFCELIDSLDLFPVAPEAGRLAAVPALDVPQRRARPGARQAGQPLHGALGREPQPLTFVVSLRLGEPPTLEPVERRLANYPTLRFKLDPTSSWTPELIAELVATGAVDSVDFKSLYTGTIVDQPPDPVLYQRVVEAFPDAWIEDPDVVTPETAAVAGRRARPDHLGRADPLDRRHRVAAVPAAHGQHQAVADRRAGEAVCDLRLLRRARHRRLRRRPVRARPRAGPGAVPGLAVPSRHAQRPRARGVQRERPAGGAAVEPAAAVAGAGRLPLGVVP